MNVYTGEKVYEYHWINGERFRIEAQTPWCVHEIKDYQNKGTPPTQHQGDFKILKKSHEKARSHNT